MAMLCMTTSIKLYASGVVAIGFFMVIAGVYFLNKGNDQMNMVNATATQLANASSTTSMGSTLIVGGVIVAIIGALLSMAKGKRKGRFH